jgi:hypothetical protein
VGTLEEEFVLFAVRFELGGPARLLVVVEFSEGLLEEHGHLA